MSSQTRSPSPYTASRFSIVLGLASLGQAWRASAPLWNTPHMIGECLLLAAGLVWLWLLVGYLAQAIRTPAVASMEFTHPVQGATPALLGVATLLMVPAIRPYSPAAANLLLAAGMSWHLAFALWHTGDGWRRGRDAADVIPTVYLPTVAGNFTCGSAFGAVQLPDIGWLFLGAGLFSWLALESLILQRIWRSGGLPPERRATLGIHFAPAAVAGASWLAISPGSTDHWILMLWGYGIFQLMLGLRLAGWLGAQPFSHTYWSYTFGSGSAAVIGVKLAYAGSEAVTPVAALVFVLANIFVLYLLTRMAIAAAHRVG